MTLVLAHDSGRGSCEVEIVFRVRICLNYWCVGRTEWGKKTFYVSSFSTGNAVIYWDGEGLGVNRYIFIHVCLLEKLKSFILDIRFDFYKICK